METTARNRTIGGIVIGAILLVLLLILFSCTLASDPEKQAKKSDNPIGSPTGTPTLSPYGTPSEKPGKKHKKHGQDSTDVVAATGTDFIPVASTGVSYDPPGQIPQGFTAPPKPHHPASAGVNPCSIDPSLCEPSTPPVTPPPPGGGGSGPAPVPGCPSVTVSNVKPHSADVAWTVVSGASYYVLTTYQPGLLGGTYHTEYYTSKHSTTDEGLNKFLGQNPRVKVTAYNSAGQSSTCAYQEIPLTVGQPGGGPPQSPQNLSCTGRPGGSADLNWDDNPDADHFMVEVDANDGTNTSYRATESAYPLRGLKRDSTYRVIVRSYDSDGQSSGTNQLTWPRDCDHEPPSPPTDVRVTHATGTAMDVAWTAATDDTYVDKYEVQAYQDGQPVGQPVEVQGDQTTASVAGLQKSTEYTFVVTAVDPIPNSTDSEMSAPYSTTDKDDTTPPSVPVGLTDSEITTDSYVVSWAPSTDDQSSQQSLRYHVHVTVGPIPVDDCYVTGDTSCQVSTNGMGPGTYAATVTATDQANNASAASNSLDTVVPAASAQPAAAAPAARPMTAKALSASKLLSPSESASSDPSVVPSVPAILAPLAPSSSPAGSDSSSPRTTTDEPSETPTPSPTPSETPSSSPGATTDDNGGLAGVVSGVVGAVTGGQ